MKRDKKSVPFFLHIKPGISLIECVVYLTISLFLVSTVFYWIIHTAIPLMHKGKNNTRYAQTYSALQLFIHDIHQAPAELTIWKKISNSELIWHTGNDDVGWQFYSNGRLVRSMGVYSKREQKWIKKSGSLVATHIQNGFFHVNSSDGIVTSVVFNGSLSDFKKNQKVDFNHAVRIDSSIDVDKKTFREHESEVIKSAKVDSGRILSHEIWLKNRVVR